MNQAESADSGRGAVEALATIDSNRGARRAINNANNYEYFVESLYP